MKRAKNIYHYQIKKCKKAEESIKRNKLLDACLNGNGDIFKEIKSLRKCKPVVSSSIDGKKENIQEHFKSIYKDLYNSIEDKKNVEKVLSSLNAGMINSHTIDVDQVSASVVKRAVNHLQDHKSDPVF